MESIIKPYLRESGLAIFDKKTEGMYFCLPTKSKLGE